MVKVRRLIMIDRKFLVVQSIDKTLQKIHACERCVKVFGASPAHLIYIRFPIGCLEVFDCINAVCIEEGE